MYARFMHQTLTNLTVPTYNLHSVVSKVEQDCNVTTVLSSDDKGIIIQVTSQLGL